MAAATITLVDGTRQWFKSHPGLEVSETSRALSFCSVAMHLSQPLIVDDTHRDSRFAHNGLVTGKPHLRFYAGAPLVSSEGFPLGAVCLLDIQPRTPFPSQLQLLTRARDWVQANLELRRLNRLVAQAGSMDSVARHQIEKWRTFAQYRVGEVREQLSSPQRSRSVVRSPSTRPSIKASEPSSAETATPDSQTTVTP